MDALSRITASGRTPAFPRQAQGPIVADEPRSFSDRVELSGGFASPVPAGVTPLASTPVPHVKGFDTYFEQRAVDFARFARTQSEAGFRVALRLSPAQVRKLSDTQMDILTRNQIEIDVVDTPLASARPGASRFERALVDEENDRQMLTPNSYFANNYVITPRTVLHMEG